MSIWTRISDALAALAAGESLADVFEKLRTPPERTVGFTIAVIALSAKMAKADGLVTRDEVTAFREVFFIPEEDAANAAKVFNLARQDVAGFEDYAKRIARMFNSVDGALRDLMEGLFYIAVADGRYHDNEDLFLKRVADIFGLPEQDFIALRMRFVPDAEPDPYVILGVSRDQSLDEIRSVWRAHVRDSHPDKMVARGVPEEAVRMAERRMVAYNRAWETIQEMHA